MKDRNYNDYDNPSTNMRVNSSLLKHILIVSKWCTENETPVLVKSSANEVQKRVNKYCTGHYNKVFEEINTLEH